MVDPFPPGWGIRPGHPPPPGFYPSGHSGGLGGSWFDDATTPNQFIPVPASIVGISFSWGSYIDSISISYRGGPALGTGGLALTQTG